MMALATSAPGSATTRRSTSFQLLARVLFRHDYFAGARVGDWAAVPEPQTRRFMQRFGMALRCNGQEMAVFIEGSQLAGLWSERDEDGQGRQLRFTIFSRDSNCAYYTDTNELPQPAEFVALAGNPLMQPIATQVVASSLKPGALAVVALPLAGAVVIGADGAPQPLAAEYELRLRARATVWKYLLVGDWAEDPVRVVDVRDRVQFSAAQLELLPDGRNATTVYSMSPIGLSEQPALRFQLRGGERSSERILISRMPTASPSGLRHEVVGGVMTEVSEIFINR